MVSAKEAIDKVMDAIDEYHFYHVIEHPEPSYYEISNLAYDIMDAIYDDIFPLVDDFIEEGGDIDIEFRGHEFYEDMDQEFLELSFMVIAEKDGEREFHPFVFQLWKIENVWEGEGFLVPW